MTPSYGGNDDPPHAQQHKPVNGSPPPAALAQRGLAAVAWLRALQAAAARRLIAARMRLGLTMRLRVWLVAALRVTPVPAPQRRVFPGHPREVAEARRFVASLLAGCPVADTAVLLTSEVVTNALAHTPSGDGGTFEVVVWRAPARHASRSWTAAPQVRPLRDASTPTPRRGAALPWSLRLPPAGSMREVPPAGRCGSCCAGRASDRMPRRGFSSPA